MNTARSTRSNRERILDAAETLFGSRGYADVKISEVCRASGFPVGSIYHHFTNKAGLLKAVLERGTAEFFDTLPAVDDLASDPLECLGVYYDAAGSAIESRLPLFRLMCLLQLQQDRSGELAEILAENLQRSVDRLVAVIEPVARRCGVVNPRRCANELAGLSVAFTAGLVVAAGGRRQPSIRMGMDQLRRMILMTVRERADARSAVSH
ncbi:TetR/AcrR family transcriptional regulator [Streptomyces vastus]|uniref:TetR/AcrR family transcriptional regulator n=1 Tax=Streptomyces vastus TaxID=285451 RepID=A0ABN3R918_9ACTN